MGRVAVAVIVSMWVIPITLILNRIVPLPYMDEIFHIPQAQQYCSGNFRSWDPMITTPPGLYYLSLAHIASLFPGTFFFEAASSFSDLCSPQILRSLNGVLAVTCSIVVYEIIIHLRPTLDKKRATLYAVVLALYPLHWFFTFLYYTDVASLTAVLSMYLACMKKYYKFSAMLGALAVLIRQTNIIWMLFVASTGILEITIGNHWKVGAKVDDDFDVSNRVYSQFESGVSGGLNVRRRKSGVAVDASNNYMPSASGASMSHESGFLDEIYMIILRSWHMKWELVVSFLPFFMILTSFVAFVRWNGSVVLGAKEAHSVSPHFAQIMYFGLISALAMAPLHFTFRHASALFISLWKNRPLSFFKVFMALIAAFVSVHFFSIAHPYLLADNRHYPFYLWRKVIKAHWSMKYLLVPLYIYSWLSIFNLLGKLQRKIWILIYFVASAAVLIPAPLIELRYYTIPFYLLILHARINSIRSWIVMGILYSSINAFTMMMFLFRPFHWDHEPGVQRFIW